MYAQVIVDIAHSEVDRLFTYAVPEDMTLKLGQHVLVPFGRGNKPIEGFVLGLMEEAPEEMAGRIKPVLRILEPYPIFTQEQLELARWIQQNYHCVLVDALRLMIPAQLRGGRIGEKTVRTVQVAENLDIGAARASLLKKDGTPKAPRQSEVFELLIKTGAPMSVKDIAAFLPGAEGAVSALIKKGLVAEENCVTFRRPAVKSRGSAPVKLTAEQNKAVEAVSEGMRQGDGVFLLHGVTGSGKTEVYMHCISRCIAEGKQAILLVPEIALTPQTMGLFRARFGDNVAVLHSRLSAGERFDEWRRIRLGMVQVAVGARSAVFAPFENLGLLIVDEEHEPTYQSELSPRYQAVEVARKRASMAKAPLILGSATPSIQSYYRAKTGVYTLIELTERVQKRPMPEIKIVDMRQEFLRGNTGIFSGALFNALDSCLRAKKQAILFINRRGYSTFVSCRACGYVFQCSDCDISMTYHRTEECVKCHYCGHTEAVPTTCPSCGQPFIKYFGVGTQQVEEQLREHFPEVRALRMDLDSTRTKDAHETLLSSFARGEAQVLIGTQMVAKGLDFPDVTLVGVVAADSSLYLPDYRSAERTFQLLTQVAGRAGRDLSPGRVIIQTYSPGHPSIAFARTHDYKGFFVYELAQRKAALFPPFSLFVRALFTGLEEDALKQDGVRYAKGLEEAVKEALSGHGEELLFLSAAPAPIYKKQGMYRFAILVKLLRTPRTAAALKAIYEYTSAHRGERFASLEINPGDLF